MCIPEYKIRSNYGHYEAVDNAGQIICTGDTWAEVENDVVDMIRAMVRGLGNDNGASYTN